MTASTEGVVWSPIGVVRFVVGRAGIEKLSIDVDSDAVPERESADGEGGAGEVARQLREYFAGTRRTFELPFVLPRGSEFACKILQALLGVGYGETVSYGELAARAGYPGAARAVGRIMAGNPIPLIVPCHRVVGKHGSLTGYSGGAGTATKEWLLSHERQVAHGCHNDPH